MKLQKETNLHGKWYQDACVAAFGMELVGERWTLLIVRELILGGLRFSDIRAALPGISAKVLTERLVSLEETGILVRRTGSEGLNIQTYELTEWGRGLEDVMQALGRWAIRSPMHDPTLRLTPVSLMLSLRTMLDTAAVEGLSAYCLFKVGDARFSALFEGGAMHVTRGQHDDRPYDVMFDAAAPLDYLRVFYGKEPLGTPSSGLNARGDPALVQRIIGAFRLPPKALVDESTGT